MRRLSLLLLLFLGLIAQAQEREAFRTAEAFVARHGQFSKTTITLQQVIESETRQLPNLFVFDVGGQGFVIVAASQEVLAFSCESVFPEAGDIPENVAYWLDIYNQMVDRQMASLQSTPLRKPHGCKQAIGPLLSSKWSQGCYYNDNCPTDPDGPCSHAWAGCVAVAMGQIMYYHRQPLIGEGSHSYLCPQYQQTLSADFGRTCYLWEEMCDSLSEPNPQVAQLIYHCGVSINSFYTNNNTVASSSDVPAAFKDYFGFPRSSMVQRKDYTDEEWCALVIHDLDLGLPLFYSASNSSGSGHAFVCDGYNEEGFFHFNFGWGGNSNGFYSIDDPYGFSVKQKLIHDIIPKSTAQIVSDSHGIVYLDPEGTGNGSSWENASSELQAAINKSSLTNLTLWLKEGIYQNPDNGNYAFQLSSPCSIYGSFKGDEPYDYPLEQRDFSTHPSILEGNDFQGVLTLSENLLFGDSLSIDGVCIRNGVANNGGGMLLEKEVFISLNNCIISYNTARQYGGGIMLNGKTHLSLNNCTVNNNTSLRYGGGMAISYNQNLSHTLTIENTDIHHNTAKTGGGLYVTADALFLNCHIHHNQAEDFGGGLFGGNKRRRLLYNCIINNNTSHFGGGAYLSEYNDLINCTVVMNEAEEQYGGVYTAAHQTAHNSFTNCIFWGNTAKEPETQIGPGTQYSFCAIQEVDHPTNISLASDNDGTDPIPYVKFLESASQPGVTGEGGDWRLQPTSVCIDQGTEPLDFEMPETDFYGNPRWQHHAYDLGAYETNVAAHLIEAPICDGHPFDYNGIQYYEGGYYTQWLPGNEYDSLLIIQLSAGSLPELSIVGDTIINQGNTARLSVTGADTYLWSTGDTTATIEVAPLETQTYTVTGINYGGCQSQASIQVCVKQSGENSVLLVPQPAHDRVWIIGNQIKEVDLYNLVGERLCHLETADNQVELDTQCYPSGIYIINIKQVSASENLRLMIVH